MRGDYCRSRQTSPQQGSQGKPLPSPGLATVLRSLLACGLVLLLWLGLPGEAAAQLHRHADENGLAVVRSLESLRDLDYQAWQLVAYRQGPPGGPLLLRIVGYPGKVRLDHPTALLVSSGRSSWQLSDLTLANPQLAGDGRSAAAEFDLAPLLADLQQNRPLRLRLPGVFTELPVPPFVVMEWRSLPTAPG